MILLWAMMKMGGYISAFQELITGVMDDQRNILSQNIFIP